MTLFLHIRVSIFQMSAPALKVALIPLLMIWACSHPSKQLCTCTNNAGAVVGWEGTRQPCPRNCLQLWHFQRYQVRVQLLDVLVPGAA